MALRTYDVGKVLVSISGYQVTGFSDGDAVRITTQPQYTTQIGVDGSESRSRSNNKSAMIELNLQQTSPANVFLKGVAENDDGSGTGVFLFAIKDVINNILHTGKGWISKEPDYSYGGEVQEWTWTFECGNMTTAAIGSDPTAASQQGD